MMKKYFCFYCQQDVTPYAVWKWKFCPHCYKFMQDDGNGFYMVCDRCGANMPSASNHCLKCGHGFYGNNDVILSIIPWYKKAFIALLGVFILSFFIMLGIGVLYVSFYFLIVFFIVAALFYILNFLRLKL